MIEIIKRTWSTDVPVSKEEMMRKLTEKSRRTAWRSLFSAIFLAAVFGLMLSSRQTVRADVPAPAMKSAQADSAAAIKVKWSIGKPEKGGFFVLYRKTGTAEYKALAYIPCGKGKSYSYKDATTLPGTKYSYKAVFVPSERVEKCWISSSSGGTLEKTV